MEYTDFVFLIICVNESAKKSGLEMQSRLLVLPFVVTVVIKLGIRKHKENIPQIYIQIQGHPPVVP